MRGQWSHQNGEQQTSTPPPPPRKHAIPYLAGVDEGLILVGLLGGRVLASRLVRGRHI